MGLVVYSSLNHRACTNAAKLDGQIPPDWLLHKINPMPSVSLDVGCDAEYINLVILSSISMTILAIFVIAWLVRIIVRTSINFQSHINVVLHNSDDCVHLPLRRLNKCPISYTLKFDGPTDFTLEGVLGRTLSIIWKNMHLHDKYSREIIQFLKRINVPLIQLTKLRHLLNVGHKIDIVFQHNMFNFFPIRDNCTCEVIEDI